jgi:hypothetical protein
MVELGESDEGSNKRKQEREREGSAAACFFSTPARAAAAALRREQRWQPEDPVLVYIIDTDCLLVKMQGYSQFALVLMHV